MSVAVVAAAKAQAETEAEAEAEAAAEADTVSWQQSCPFRLFASWKGSTEVCAAKLACQLAFVAVSSQLWPQERRRCWRCCGAVWQVRVVQVATELIYNCIAKGAFK